MKKIRLISIMLALIISASFLSCSNNSQTDNSGNNNVTEKNSNTSADTVETADPYNDELETEDFGGYEFRINSRDNPWLHGNILAEEMNGEVLNDAMYQRQVNVAERFNVVFTEEVHDDGNSTVARNAILANEDAYDLINARCTAALAFAQEGLVLPLSQLPYINLDKVYWDKSLTEDANIGNNMYYPIGDMSLAVMDMTALMCFNKQMIQDFDLENPYNLVNDLKWTFDKYLEMTSAVVSDIDGNGKWDENDRYGTLGATFYYGYSLLMANNVKAINKDDNNNPVFDAPTNEKFINAWNRTIDIMYSNNQWFDSKTGGQADEKMNSIFKENKALFYGTAFSEIEALRDMETDFGIIPFPMADESVGRYYTRANWFEAHLVPITNSDTNRTSKIIEALAAESGRLVFPAYYEIAISSKTARDEESIQMLDIIKNSRILDLADNLWCDQIRNGFLVSMLDNKSTEIVSALEKRAKSVTKTLEKAIEGFNNSGN